MISLPQLGKYEAEPWKIPFVERMRQFYETYAGNELVAPLVRQIPWTYHLIQLPDKALLRAKLHEFYLQNTQVDEDATD